jgi:hypothetical protein
MKPVTPAAFSGGNGGVKYLAFLISTLSVGKLITEVNFMEPTYSDIYAHLKEDPAMEEYFSKLPGHIQAQIRARKHQPASLEDLKRMAEEAEQVF